MKKKSEHELSDMFNIGPNGKISENMQSMTDDGIAKGREVLTTFTRLSKHQGKAAQKVMCAAQSGTQAINEAVASNMSANANALFDAAQAIASAKSFDQVVRLQAEFMQKQAAVFAQQTQELVQLATSEMQRTFEATNDAATKSIKKMQKEGLGLSQNIAS